MSKRTNNPATASKKLTLSLLVGLIAAAVMTVFGSWEFAPLVGWDTAALAFVVSVWLVVWPMNAGETKDHALREDPARAVADIVLIGASLASLIAVGFLIVQASNEEGLLKIVEVFLGLFSVVVSWVVVQTTHTLKYAGLYYGDTEGGINFNQNAPPRYQDFAYLAFTLGMTFQVSDSDIQTKEIRTTALKHSILSYIFGTVIIATTINTIASLGK